MCYVYFIFMFIFYFMFYFISIFKFKFVLSCLKMWIFISSVSTGKMSSQLWRWLTPTMCCNIQFSSVQFSRSVVSDSLWPHGLQHARLTCPSPTPEACSNSHPLSQWCHPTISSSVVPFSSSLQSFQASGSFLMSELFPSWSKYWSFSFSFSPSSKYSGLISFRSDWFDFLAVQGTLESSPTPQLKASILQC